MNHPFNFRNNEQHNQNVHTQSTFNGNKKLTNASLYMSKKIRTAKI